MKTNVQKTEPKTFKPVVVTITLETQEELDAFGALSNSAWIADCMREQFSCPINLPYADLAEAGANIRAANSFQLALKTFLNQKC